MRQFKQLLDELPVSVAVVSDTQSLQFYNNECGRIFGQRDGQVSLDDFAQVRELDSDNNPGTSVRDVILSSPVGSPPAAVPRRYVLAKNPPNYFALLHTRLRLDEHSSSVWILQDQTSFVTLKMLDEKYKQLYLASVVHDIRTPINGILGMLDVLEQYSANISGSREDYKTYISVARNSAQLLLFYTYDITDYTQIEAGTFAINPAVFFPSSVVAECVQLLEFNFGRKGVLLVKEIEPNAPTKVYGDRHRYMQILLNLLGNALKFTFHGEVRITLSGDSGGKGMLVTSVKDTGVGIRTEDIPKLFHFFGKLSQNSELNPTGVGMGLAICKKLAECMGGGIRVDSEYGSGSTFTFSVPENSVGGESIPEAKKEAEVCTCGEVADEVELNLSQQNDSHNFCLLIHGSPLSQRRLLTDPEDVHHATLRTYRKPHTTARGSSSWTTTTPTSSSSRASAPSSASPTMLYCSHDSHEDIIGKKRGGGY